MASRYAAPPVQASTGPLFGQQAGIVYEGDHEATEKAADFEDDTIDAGSYPADAANQLLGNSDVHDPSTRRRQPPHAFAPSPPLLDERLGKRSLPSAANDRRWGSVDR